MRRQKRRQLRVTLCLLLVACLTVTCVVTVDARLRPLVQSYGMMSARRSAMLAVHSGVEQVLSEHDVDYRSFVTVVRDETAGRVLSLETDVTAINRMKAAVSNAVMQALTACEKQRISVPLGILIGGSFFTGRGPFLPITVHTSGTVITTLSGEFSDAGINQTNHTLYLDMQVMITAALPLERVFIELETRFPVCDTVIVGEVPQTVLQMDLGESVSKFFGTAD